ncbi:MAG: acyl-CoA dehydrogenase family protein [Chloroflexi bacterium]|nr:acyl-CoA dehydrogenase family protein [Chloroflexota bacterium]
MDFKFSPEEEAFRQEVRDFIKQELPPGWMGLPGESTDDENWRFSVKMRKKLAEKKWLTLHWPKEYGGLGAPILTQLIFGEEMSYHRCPGTEPYGTRFMAPVLMISGTEEQKKRFLPPVARGEVAWCQLFSEPGTGSDLAGLQTRAERDGDDYVINGTKMWTSQAHRADWGIMLARTNPNEPRHRGISMFFVSMRSPGVTIHPIMNMAGYHHFNQETFDNVRVPKENLIGEENRGFYLGMTTMDFERSGVGYSAGARRNCEDLARFIREEAPTRDRLVQNLRVRHNLAELYIEAEAARSVSYKIGWMQASGQVPNKEASLGKVFGTELTQRVARFGLGLLGPYAHLTSGSPWAVLNGRFQGQWLTSIGITLDAGSSEIQRNVIATRGLGLPRG